MIRIDEIYYNTFVSYLQGRTQTSVHWFDPFGSVRFEDLKNSAQINNKQGDAQRYLFWDQEPMHPDLFNQFAQQFVDIYDGHTHLITSERNSAYVNWAVDTYGFVPHYYFFHGWAALDWYRGYDKSFLISPPWTRTITRTFIAPNRIVAGAREHRLIMMYHLIKNNLLDNHISFPQVCPAEGTDIMTAILPLKARYPDIEAQYRSTLFPLQFDGEAAAPNHSYCLDLIKQSTESLLYLVTETVAHGQRQHLTEKTFKPICLGMPFVIVGTQGSLEYLRSYGFRTFGDLWDESYDTIADTDQRIAAIADLLKQLDSLPLAERQQLHAQAQEIVVHNYLHFYEGNFERVLWSELTAMINEF